MFVTAGRDLIYVEVSIATVSVAGRSGLGQQTPPRVCSGWRRQTSGDAPVEHHGMGQREFVQWLSELVGGRTSEVAVGIEIPRGAIVEGLQERGFAVFAINPKQLDRFRDRYGMGGAKDDGRDAFVLADSLRTDLHCFRRVVIEDALILQIREMSRTRDDLQTEFGRLANQLREQLLRYSPHCSNSVPLPTNLGFGICSRWPPCQRKPPNSRASG